MQILYLLLLFIDGFKHGLDLQIFVFDHFIEHLNLLLELLVIFD